MESDKYISASCQYNMLNDDVSSVKAMLIGRLKDRIAALGYDIPNGFDDQVVFNANATREVMSARIYISDILWLMKITV